MDDEFYDLFSEPSMIISAKAIYFFFFFSNIRIEIVNFCFAHFAFYLFILLLFPNLSEITVLKKQIETK